MTVCFELSSIPQNHQCENLNVFVNPGTGTYLPVMNLDPLKYFGRIVAEKKSSELNRTIPHNTSKCQLFSIVILRDLQ